MEIKKTNLIFNKNNAKKIFVSLLAATTMIASASPVLAEIKVNVPALIHEKQSSIPISSGVTHEHIQKFTSLGWWNINVLRVDLTDPFTKVQGLFNDQGISSRDRVSSMISKSNAVAGINGDLFNYSPLPVSLGTLINNGEIISTRGDHADPLPGIFIDFLNNAKIDYLKRKTTATNLSTGDSLQISIVNSLTTNFNLPIVLTPKWGEKSIGKKYHNDLVEVVVVEDIVTDVRDSNYAISIPKNGYVIVARGPNGDKLKKFSVGDRISFSVTSNIDIKNTSFSMGGASYILENGQLRKPDITIAGNHPRSGIGISKDGKELLLVTIDGRGTSFKGVSQEMFASILRDLGAYNAMNLDGGGSTTMAIKALDKDKAQIVNTPSDGGERAVVNGVGVFSTAPKDKLSYLKLSTNDNKMFPNTNRDLIVNGYDKYHNPIKIDPSKLSFDYDTEKGTMTGNKFKAISPGKTSIIATYEDVEGKLDLEILNEAVDIISYKSDLYLDINSEVRLPMFYGTDSNGVKSNIYPEDLEFEIINDIGSVKDNIFYSNNKIAAGILSAKLGKGIENIKISVGLYEILIHDFDSLGNVEFSSYPDLVKGSISLDSSSKTGSSSLKLKYDFSAGNMTRAAYIDFFNSEEKLENEKEGDKEKRKEGMAIKGRPSKLSLWIKGDNSGSWLRASLIDNKDKEHIIDFDKSIDWTGWKFKTANLPSNISYPIKLKRIYVAETDSSKKTLGEISIDGLTGSYPPNLGDLKVPGPSNFKDSLNVKKEVQKNGFSFGVNMEPKGINELVKYDALSQIRKVASKNDFSVFLNGLSGEFANTLKSKPLFDASGAYKTQKYKDSLFIKLDTRSGGIRASDSKQWNHMFYSISASDSKNIFLLLDSPVWGSNGFKDTLEADFLHEYLLDHKGNGKNVFVIQGGSSNTSILKDGIRYLELDTRSITKAENIYNLSSIDFVVNDSEITYQINPVFNK